VLEECDPRVTQGFPQTYYDLCVELLNQPWSLNADTLRLLDRHLARQPRFAAALQDAGVQREAFLTAVSELGFAERLHLLEAAQVRHAPGR
jgi:hypothetical protein